jgi:hypothetical protein
MLTLSLFLPLGLTVTSIIYLILCFKLDLGTPSFPREGFVPLIVGILLFIGSCYLTINAIITAKNMLPPSQKTPKIEKINFLLLVGTLFGYLITLKVLGFTFSTFLLIVVSAKIFSAKWRSAFLLALGFTITCYVIFIYWFNIPFPSSIFMR